MILYTSLIEAKEGIEACAVALGNFDGVHKGHQALISNCVKTAKEQGIDLTSSSDRGMVAPPTLDKDVLNKLVDALKKVQEDPEFQKKAASYGMGINMLFGEDFEKYIQGVEDTLNGMKKDLGWE